MLGKPSDDAIQRFPSLQRGPPFSYKEVGASRVVEASREVGAPPGYAVDLYQVKLGEGAEAYERAVEALRGWRQFDLGWARLLPPDAPMAVGTTVGVRAYDCGFGSLNPTRIVYLVEEMGDVKRFGFGYGTLPGHASRGEERFRVEWNREDGCVYHDVFAFSRPKYPLAWLGYPFARALQRRFARDSKRVMLVAASA